jgi:hypothetical protein
MQSLERRSDEDLFSWLIRLVEFEQDREPLIEQLRR